MKSPSNDPNDILAELIDAARYAQFALQNGVCKSDREEAWLQLEQAISKATRE